MNTETLQEFPESSSKVRQFVLCFIGTMLVLFSIIFFCGQHVSWDFAFIMALSACVAGGHLVFYKFEVREAPSQMIAGICAMIFVNAMTVCFVGSMLHACGMQQYSTSFVVLLSIISIGGWVAFVELIEHIVRKKSDDNRLAYPKWLFSLLGAFTSALIVAFFVLSGVSLVSQ